MTSERSKRRDFLSLIFIAKSISKKLLIKILCFIFNKIKCVTGLLFCKIHGFLFWTKHRGEGWFSGHSTRLPSIWPGFRSCYVRHIWVRDRSLFIAWGQGRRILGGITWFLGVQKGGSVVTENPKAGIAENFGRIESDHPNFAWKMKTRGRGRSWKSSKVIRGDHCSEVTFKGGIAQISPRFAPNRPPPLPPAINNDKSLRPGQFREPTNERAK